MSLTTIETPDPDISHFVDIIEKIKNSYAKNLNDGKILEDAIRGMVANLDPHSEYLDEEAYKTLIIATSGEFGGLGVEIAADQNAIKVIAPIDGSPAAKAGLKAGDYIVAINNKLVDDLKPDAAVKEMRGPKGSHVLLTVIRPGQGTPLKFDVIRDIIQVESVKSKMLDNDFAYIRLNQFQEPSAKLMIAAIKKLQTNANHHLQGLILDLRNNPGGLLESAVDVANAFLNSDQLFLYKKMIVSTESRVSSAKFEAHASGQDILKGAPLIILINEGSASASEIVAGALQDYHRALIVGTPSFGKGSVQTILPLDKTHALKITTALYLTPAGRIIQNQGIRPDVYLANLKLTDEKISSDGIQIRDYALQEHLKNFNAKPAKNDMRASALLAEEDFTLYEARNILKTLVLLHLEKQKI